MFHHRRAALGAGIACLLLASILASLTSCRTVPTAEGTSAAALAEPGGARLWRENCMRCHNLRDPQERSDAEWETLVHHMRVRANLTGEEARRIARFLQAAN